MKPENQSNRWLLPIIVAVLLAMMGLGAIIGSPFPEKKDWVDIIEVAGIALITPTILICSIILAQNSLKLQREKHEIEHSRLKLELIEELYDPTTVFSKHLDKHHRDDAIEIYNEYLLRDTPEIDHISPKVAYEILSQLQDVISSPHRDIRQPSSRKLGRLQESITFEIDKIYRMKKLQLEFLFDIDDAEIELERKNTLSHFGPMPPHFSQLITLSQIVQSPEVRKKAMIKK